MTAATTSASSPATIVAQGLGKRFNSRKALDSLDLTLPHGAFLTVFGPNGAGKTTLLNILATLSRPSSGQITVLGYDPAKEPDLIRQSIGVISHRSMLYPDLTAEENLLLYARLYGAFDPEAKVSELLALVELQARRHDTVRGFSRGMAQRLAIARALVNDPQLLLLDEPYSGLDPRAVSILDNLIDRVRPGRSFVMVSHDLAHGYRLSSHLLVLSQGRSAGFFERQEIGQAAFEELYHETVGVA